MCVCVVSGFFVLHYCQGVNLFIAVIYFNRAPVGDNDPSPAPIHTPRNFDSVLEFRILKGGWGVKSEPLMGVAPGGLLVGCYLGVA